MNDCWQYALTFRLTRFDSAQNLVLTSLENLKHFLEALLLQQLVLGETSDTPYDTPGQLRRKFESTKDIYWFAISVSLQRLDGGGQQNFQS